MKLSFFSKKKKFILPKFLVFIFWLSSPFFHLARSFQPPLASRNLPSEQSGIIIYIYDGDTFKIKLRDGERRIRLLGVDAPEIGSPSEEIDLWARLARRFASFYLYQKKIKLHLEKEREDRYGRLLAYIWLDEKNLFNELIIQEGLARYLERNFLSPPMKRRLEQAEAEARERKKGLWQNEWPRPIKEIEADNHQGELKVVSFICDRVRVERGYTLLLGRSEHFQVYISKDRRPLFSLLEKIKPGDRLLVFGLIEEYRGKSQLSLFYPSQLKLVSKMAK